MSLQAKRWLVPLATANVAIALTMLGPLANGAQAVRGHEFAGTFGSKGTSNGDFREPAGVAIDEASGDVYVADRINDRVERFTPSGTFLSKFNGAATPAKAFAGPTGIAIDNSGSEEDPSAEDVYVVDSEHHVIDKFSASGVYISQLSETTGGQTFEEIEGITVDRSGNLWVYQENGLISEFSDTGGFLKRYLNAEEFGPFGFVNAIAVDARGDAYLISAFETLQKYNSQGEQVGKNGQGGGAESESYLPTALAINESSNVLFADEGGSITEIRPFGEPFNEPIQTFGAGVLAGSFGVAVDAASETVYATEREADMVARFVPERPAAPTVEASFADAVSERSAQLHATINPHGAKTTYYVEYGAAGCAESSSCTKQPLPPGASLGEGFGSEAVTISVEGLSPATVYHYRVIATNALGSAMSVEATLRTRPAQSAPVPADNRAWEAVSPVSSSGASILPLGRGAIQAAGGGAAIAFQANAPMQPEPPSNDLKDTEMLAARASGGGWSAADIATPHTEITGFKGKAPPEYRLFAASLSLAAVEPLASAPLAPSATERTLYERQPDGSYLPLVTAANVPAGTKFGGQLEFAGASEDLEHVVIASTVALASQPAPSGGLYEWSAGSPGVLSLISILPDGEAAALTKTEVSGLENPTVGGQVDHRGAVSRDGQRVVWSYRTPGSETHHLFLRDLHKGETIQLDAAQGVSEPAGGHAVFQAASADGRRIFFTDRERLTPDATATGGAQADLYVCEVLEAVGKLGCKLTDLSTSVLTPGETAGVQGALPGIDAAGTAVYFVANGRLTNAASRGECPGREGGNATCSLYVERYDSGSESWGPPALIDTLSQADGADWSESGTGRGADQAPAPGRLTAAVSPDGRYLAFMSDRSLTGYDNHDAASGAADEEVYLYDREANETRCVSCNPTGARPAGWFDSPLAANLVDPLNTWSGRWLAANIPTWSSTQSNDNAYYQSRYLNDSGRLFFDSADALVPQDVNGRPDVYEYEPPGIGDCSGSSASFSEHAAGCVSLISSGTTSDESAFMDASESGGDVFFLSDVFLSEQTGSGVALYDAHECTSVAPCPPPAAATTSSCLATSSCHSAVSPLPGIYAPPASQMPSGAGNLTSTVQQPATRRRPTRAQLLARALRACRREPKRKRHACEAGARRRYGPKHHTKHAKRGHK